MKTPSILERILDPFQWDNVIALLTGGGLSDQEALELVLGIFLHEHGEPDARNEPASVALAH